MSLQQQAMDLVERYRSLIGVEELWTIVIEVDPDLPSPGCVNVQSDLWLAVIVIHPATTDLEHVIVHELVELSFWATGELASIYLQGKSLEQYLGRRNQEVEKVVAQLLGRKLIYPLLAQDAS